MAAPPSRLGSTHILRTLMYTVYIVIRNIAIIKNDNSIVIYIYVKINGVFQAVWSACDTFWEFDTAHTGAITREAGPFMA